MNSNQLMLTKAMVTQSALREEARESRRRRTDSGRARGTAKDRSVLGLLRRR
jgi:hypothetical protein